MNKDNKPKVLLRALEPEDLDLLYGIENNPEVWDVSPTNVPYSRYVLHNYLANTVNDIYVDKQVRFVIDADKEQCIGLLDVVHFDPKHRRAEVSIVLRKEFRKKRPSSKCSFAALRLFFACFASSSVICSSSKSKSSICRFIY